MATTKTTSVSVFLIFICFCSSLSSINAHINVWCSKTPHPEACKTHMSPQTYNPKGKSDFKKMTIHAAMEHTHHAQSHIVSLGSKCRDEREKAAWADCVKLYEHSVHHLNKTIDSVYSDCTDSDRQTWLSTALTNLETCRDGFIDFKVSDNVLPLMSNDASKLISNSLAVSKVEENEKQTYKHGLPTWVAPGDRKLLYSRSTAVRANLVVAQDGSGSYRTIQAAINAAPQNSRSRFVIHVKGGVYRENLDIGRRLTNIMLVGDGLKYTIITSSRSVVGGSTTFNSATVGALGEGFMARGITFRNTAGAQNHQAVALRSGSDKSVFYLCSIEGYQDTLYVHSQRQFYKECYIYGTVDFIFGNAAVVLQSCAIFARRPITGQECTMTAQGRMDPNQNTGISIHNSVIMAASDLARVQSYVKSYLGRPWKEYSRTVYMNNYIGSLIDPSGWLAWNGNFALNTLYYGEYQNNGPGSSTTRRVRWRGYHVIKLASVASQFTVGRFIAGNSWLAATGVPYTSGL